MRFGLGAFLGLLIAFTVFSSSADAQHSLGADEKAARITLVQEFLREMEALYLLQETSKKEFAEDPSATGRLVTAIRTGTRTAFEMNDSINRLAMISVAGNWADFRDLLAKSHQRRVALLQEATEMSKVMLKGPQAGVDYGAMTARAPELTAEMENVDKTMITMAQPMFFALVDEDQLGVDGKLHHLVLTKAERTSMVWDIENSFGRSLDDNNASRIVSAAWVIKYGLTRPIYKAADEP
jgi:hypothetical protein